MLLSLSTWKHGFEPNRVTYEALRSGRSSLDAVELGARSCEGDLTCMSVGRGALPDDLGIISLDAAIMDHEGRCGSVVFLQHYENAISIARRVMEKTSHIMLAGSGAEQFAEAEGFLKTELITEKARKLYEQWREKPDKVRVRLRRSAEGDHEYVIEEISENGTSIQIDRDASGKQNTRDTSGKRNINESHDTIGILAMDRNGKLAAACTTSGLAFKKHGRVGDSPIIGAGLFVDGNVGAAVATGNGELVMRACSTFHIVEMIRQGTDINIALEIAMERLRQDSSLTDDMQVGLLAMRADGQWSSRSLRPGFQFAAASEQEAGGNTLYDCTETGFSVAL